MKFRTSILLGFLLFIQLKAFNQNLYFPPIAGNVWEKTPIEDLNWCVTKVDSFYNFLESQNTKAFILLKDGKIVLEQYFDNHTATTNWYWASAGKSLTSFMVGLAQQDGFLSIEDTTSTYLGKYWTNCTEAQENKIKIKHQLSMTTGLDDGVTNSDCTIDSCLIYKDDPENRWAYHNAPYTLLDEVIEQATGTNLNTFLFQKLTNSTGITGAYLKIDFNNVFFSNARSMAKFGLLMLAKGNWNGTSILSDSNYYNQMISPTQNLNEAYGYLWWLNGENTFMIPQLQTVFNGSISPNAPIDMFAALGKNGQILNIVPSENLVWIRMGDAPDNSLVPFTLNNDIWKYLNDLACDLNAGNIEIAESETSIFPNPTFEILNVSASTIIKHIEIKNLEGQIVYSQLSNQSILQLNIGNLPPSVYLLYITTSEGTTVKKWIKLDRN